MQTATERVNITDLLKRFEQGDEDAVRELYRLADPNGTPTLPFEDWNDQVSGLSLAREIQGRRPGLQLLMQHVINKSQLNDRR